MEKQASKHSKNFKCNHAKSSFVNPPLPDFHG